MYVPNTRASTTRFVVAEVRVGGTRWPLFTVVERGEALDLAAQLRSNGTTTVVVEIADDRERTGSVNEWIQGRTIPQ